MLGRMRNLTHLCALDQNKLGVSNYSISRTSYSFIVTTNSMIKKSRFYYKSRHGIDIFVFLIFDYYFELKTFLSRL
jgi:hypothetical protein